MTDWYKIKRVLTRVNETRLPAAYQEVEYIESDGVSCWINTWVVTRDRSYLKIEFKMMPTTLKSSGNYFYWVNTDGASNAWCSFENSSSGAYWNTWSSVLLGTHTLSTWNEYEYTVIYNNGSFSVSWSKSYSTTYSWYLWWSNKALYFFCAADDLWAQSAEKLYYLKIYQWQNFDLVREFVPCYRKSDSVIWLYDLVNDIFYTNSWTGTFTKGNDIPGLVEKQIYPAAWWEPGANTVAYYPLKSDFNDASWKWYNLTNNWGTITTLNWVSCAYYNWSSYSGNDSISFWTTRTINAWLYHSSTSWGIVVQTWEYSYNAYKTRLLGSGSWNIGLSNLQNYSIDTTSWNLNWKWVNAVWVADWDNMALYINWQLEASWSNTLYAWNKLRIWYRLWGSWSEYFTWYVNEIILEDKAWTAQEIQDYYNQTKWNYGL